ncbi:H-NS histone family protein [Variovorax sp. LT1P1]|uniref:H-NS histone family protein n=1 Tax=Variovorax sp. LT1P1 TaxID=3443730 RepID=UPI003F450512
MTAQPILDLEVQIQELEAINRALRQKADAERLIEVQSVVAELLPKIKEFEITAAELFGVGKRTRSGWKARNAPRPENGRLYTGPNGQAWTGGTRGRVPGWLTREMLASSNVT